MSSPHHAKNKEAEALSKELGIRVGWDSTRESWFVCTPKGVQVPNLRDKNGVRAVAELVGRVKALEGENVELRAQVSRLKHERG